MPVIDIDSHMDNLPVPDGHPLAALLPQPDMERMASVLAGDVLNHLDPATRGFSVDDLFAALGQGIKNQDDPSMTFVDRLAMPGASDPAGRVKWMDDMGI